MFRVSDRVVFREIDDRIVLINLDTGFYYSLNEVGCFIFNRLLKDRSPEEIVEDIQNRFEVVERLAREDFEEFVECLKTERILLCDAGDAAE